MKKKINDFLNDIVQSHHLAGVSVGIVKNSKVFSEFGIGVRNLQTQEPITPESLFHLASISKLFTATGVMQLIEKGKLSLEESLLEIIPELKIEAPFGEAMTIRHLLSHTSGIPDITDYGWDSPEYDEKALERYVHSLDIAPLFHPGSKFLYSNMAYEILGYLISKISEMTFEDYIKANILDPLGMSSSTHYIDVVHTHLAVSPHVNDLETKISKIYPYNRSHAPSSTLHSSARNMNRWALANLEHGNLFGKVILEQDLYSEMWSPQIAVGQPDRPDKKACLGWFSDKRRGTTFFYHSGQDVGFSTYFLLVPDQSLGITILCNSEPAPVEAIAFGVMDLLLGLDPEPIKPSAMQALGSVYTNSGVKGLRSAYQELIQNNPDRYDFGIKGFLAVCASLLDQNRNQEATDILTFVTETFAEEAGGYEMMARAYFQQGDYSKALASALKSLELNPENEFLRQQIKPLMPDSK